MIKDTFFNATRFMNLCRKDMVESWRTNLLRIGMIYGVMAFLFVWRGYFVYDSGRDVVAGYDTMVSISLVTFIWIAAIFGCVSASFTMAKMKSKTNRLSVLMLPATPFEKFFSKWLLSTVVYLIAIVIAFKLADYTRVVVCMLIFPDQQVLPADLKYLFVSPGHFYYLFPEVVNIGKVSCVAYFFFQSCFTLGSSIWPKNSFIKTFVSGFAITLVYGLIISGFVKLLFYKYHVNIPDLTLSEEIKSDIFIISGIVFIFLNWILAYYRFKEAEIINRM